MAKREGDANAEALLQLFMENLPEGLRQYYAHQLTRAKSEKTQAECHAIVLDLLRRITVLLDVETADSEEEPADPGDGAVEPRPEPPCDATGTHWLSFVLVEGSHVASKTAYLDLAGHLWEMYKPLFIQVADAKHLDEATMDQPNYYTRDGFACVCDLDRAPLLDAKIIDFSTDAGVHKIQKTVFRTYQKTICVIACRERSAHGIHDHEKLRPFFNRLLEEVREFTRWIIMGRFDSDQLALCGYFDVPFGKGAEICECGTMHCIAFGLSPFYKLTTMDSFGAHYWIFEFGIAISDESRPVDDVPIQQDADAPSTGALRQRSSSRALLQAIMQASPSDGSVMLFRSLFEPKVSHTSTNGDGRTRSRALSQEELFGRADQCLTTLGEIRTSVLQKRQNNLPAAACNHPLEAELSEPEFEAAYKMLREKWRVEFASAKTLEEIHALEEQIQAGYGNRRQLVRKLHDKERNGFHAWLHQFAGDKHVGQALLRFGTSPEAMVKFIQAHHEDRVFQEGQDEDDQLPVPKRSKHLGAMAGIAK